MATEVETTRVMKWNRFSPFLFSLSSCHHTSRFFPFHPVSPDFSHDVLHALVGPEYHKHRQTHLFSRRQQHTIHCLLHFKCRASVIIGKTTNISNDCSRHTVFILWLHIYRSFSQHLFKELYYDRHARAIQATWWIYLPFNALASSVKCALFPNRANNWTIKCACENYCGSPVSDDAKWQ